MTGLIVNQAIGAAVFQKLFRIVAEVETFDIEKTHRDYRDWCAEVFIEDRLDIVCGKLSMTDIEMQWVVLSVLHREIQIALDDEAELFIDVDDEHIVSTLSDNGFCPAFQEDVREICRGVLKKWRANPEDVGQ